MDSLTNPAPVRWGITEGKTMNRIYKASAKHTYELGTDKGRILVDANTRASARKTAEKAGYEVRDVNMIG